jgi:hypothetical protein
MIALNVDCRSITAIETFMTFALLLNFVKGTVDRVHRSIAIGEEPHPAVWNSCAREHGQPAPSTSGFSPLSVKPWPLHAYLISFKLFVIVILRTFTGLRVAKFTTKYII